MGTVGQIEKKTQQRVVQLFREQLGYDSSVIGTTARTLRHRRGIIAGLPPRQTGLQRSSRHAGSCTGGPLIGSFGVSCTGRRNGLPWRAGSSVVRFTGARVPT